MDDTAELAFSSYLLHGDVSEQLHLLDSATSPSALPNDVWHKVWAEIAYRAYGSSNLRQCERIYSLWHSEDKSLRTKVLAKVQQILENDTNDVDSRNGTNNVTSDLNCDDGDHLLISGQKMLSEDRLLQVCLTRLPDLNNGVPDGGSDKHASSCLPLIYVISSSDQVPAPLKIDSKGVPHFLNGDCRQSSLPFAVYSDSGCVMDNFLIEEHEFLVSGDGEITALSPKRLDLYNGTNKSCDSASAKNSGNKATSRLQSEQSNHRKTVNASSVKLCRKYDLNSQDMNRAFVLCKKLSESEIRRLSAGSHSLDISDQESLEPEITITPSESFTRLEHGVVSDIPVVNRNTETTVADDIVGCQTMTASSNSVQSQNDTLPNVLQLCDVDDVSMSCTAINSVADCNAVTVTSLSSDTTEKSIGQNLGELPKFGVEGEVTAGSCRDQTHCLLPCESTEAANASVSSPERKWPNITPKKSQITQDLSSILPDDTDCLIKSAVKDNCSAFVPVDKPDEGESSSVVSPKEHLCYNTADGDCPADVSCDVTVEPNLMLQIATDADSVKDCTISNPCGAADAERADCDRGWLSVGQTSDGHVHETSQLCEDTYSVCKSVSHFCENDQTMEVIEQTVCGKTVTDKKSENSPFGSSAPEIPISDLAVVLSGDDEDDDHVSDFSHHEAEAASNIASHLNERITELENRKAELTRQLVLAELRSLNSAPDLQESHSADFIQTSWLECQHVKLQSLKVELFQRNKVLNEKAEDQGHQKEQLEEWSERLECLRNRLLCDIQHYKSAKEAESATECDTNIKFHKLENLWEALQQEKQFRAEERNRLLWRLRMASVCNLPPASDNSQLYTGLVLKESLSTGKVDKAQGGKEQKFKRKIGWPGKIIGKSKERREKMQEDTVKNCNRSVCQNVMPHSKQEKLEGERDHPCDSLTLESAKIEQLSVKKPIETCAADITGIYRGVVDDCEDEKKSNKRRGGLSDHRAISVPQKKRQHLDQSSFSKSQPECENSALVNYNCLSEPVVKRKRSRPNKHSLDSVDKETREHDERHVKECVRGAENCVVNDNCSAEQTTKNKRGDDSVTNEIEDQLMHGLVNGWHNNIADSNIHLEKQIVTKKRGRPSKKGISSSANVIQHLEQPEKSCADLAAKFEDSSFCFAEPPTDKRRLRRSSKHGASSVSEEMEQHFSKSVRNCGNKGDDSRRLSDIFDIVCSTVNNSEGQDGRSANTTTRVDTTVLDQPAGKCRNERHRVSVVSNDGHVENPKRRRGRPSKSARAETVANCRPADKVPAHRSADVSESNGETSVLLNGFNDETPERLNVFSQVCQWFTSSLP